MNEDVMNRDDLKRHCLAALDAVAVEHPTGHQGKLAARYVLHSAKGTAIELMFEKGPNTLANLWVAEKNAAALCDGGIAFRRSPAALLYSAAEADGPPRYGRHSGLKPMRELANADLVCFTIERAGQIDNLLGELLGS